LRYIFFGLILAALFQTFFWIMHEHEMFVVHSTNDTIESLSYAPYKGNEKRYLTYDEIKSDMNLLSSYTNNIRTYSTQDALVVVDILSSTNMTMDLGLWLSSNYEDNYEELQRAFYIIENYPDIINSIIVGNETLLREDLEVEELLAYIYLVVEKTHMPVTTAEVWHTWVKYPELVSNVTILGKNTYR
jgi:exo-beta-1,3-glucanase (GH17 family)